MHVAHVAVSIESTGSLPARTLFKEAIGVLVAKCKTVLEASEDEASKHLMDAAEVAKLSIAAMNLGEDDLT